MKYTIHILLLITFLGCKKEPQKSTVTFYQLNCGGNPTLYVDDVKKGYLRSTVQQPVCGDKVQNRIITIELDLGEHTFKLDDGRNTYNRLYFNASDKCQTVRVDY